MDRLYLFNLFIGDITHAGAKRPFPLLTLISLSVRSWVLCDQNHMKSAWQEKTSVHKVQANHLFGRISGFRAMQSHFQSVTVKYMDKHVDHEMKETVGSRSRIPRTDSRRWACCIRAVWSTVWRGVCRLRFHCQSVLKDWDKSKLV